MIQGLRLGTGLTRLEKETQTKVHIKRVFRSIKKANEVLSNNSPISVRHRVLTGGGSTCPGLGAGC